MYCRLVTPRKPLLTFYMKEEETLKVIKTLIQHQVLFTLDYTPEVPHNDWETDAVETLTCLKLSAEGS